MAGNQIGTATVGVEADASKFGAGVEDAVEDSGQQAAGKAEKTGKSLGERLAGGLKFAAGAAAVGIGAVLTGALVKGFSRLSSIDSAKAKLEGLGYTGKTLQGVMDNALNSVKGTAFGLDEAVSAIPGLLAAGVKPGQDLEQALKNMGSTATLAGTSFAEVADVFGDAAASGTLTTDVLNRMAARGIPALQLVADHLGVTREQAAKMATDGSISFKQFQDALTAGIGPAALAAGNSFQGMLANTNAALGRLGAVILGPAFEGLKTLFPILMSALDELGAALTPIMERVGPGITKAFQDLGNAIKGIDWSAVAAGIAAVVNVMLDWAPTILTIVGAIVALNLAFKAARGVMLAYQGALTLIKAVQLGWTAMTYGSVGASYAMAAATNAQKVAVIAGAAAQRIATAAQWAWNAALTANPIGIIIMAIAALVAALIWFFTQTELGRELWSGFITWLQEAWTNIASFFTTLWSGIVDTFTAAWDAIVAFLTPVFDFITGLFKFYIEAWINVFLVLAAVFKVIWDGIVAFISPIVKFIGDVISNAVKGVQIVWNAVWGAISKFFNDIWTRMATFLAPIIARIQQVITVAVGVVKGIWNNTWSAISSFFSSIWNGITSALSTAINTVVSFVRGIKDKVLGAVSGAASWLFNVGKDIINGLINGIKAMVGGVMDAIGGVVNGAVDWAKNILGSNSPSKVFDQIGKDLGQGFVNGIDAMTTKVENSVSGLTNAALAPVTATWQGGNAAIAPSQFAAQSTLGSTGPVAGPSLTIADGAIRVEAEDPYLASKLVVDRISERVGTL